MGTLLHCWWECKLMQPPWKTVWRFLKKTIELPYDPACFLFLFFLLYSFKLRIEISSSICCSPFRYFMCLPAKLIQQCPTLQPHGLTCQAPLSMGFSRKGCWSRLPCPPPGELPHSGIKPKSLRSPTSAGTDFTTSTTWEVHSDICAEGLRVSTFLW